MRINFFSLISAALLLPCLNAQVASGSISGVVTDAQNAMVPNASVVVRNPATGQELKLSSNTKGIYDAHPLDPGTYNVGVSAAGFKEITVASVRVDLGAQVHLDLRLDVGNVKDSITVEATNSTLVQAESSTLQDVIENRQIIDLPLNGRSAMDLVYLSSGALKNDTPASNGDYSINGNDPTSNNFVIDGVKNRDEFRGQNAVSVPIDGIQEFIIKKSVASAEFGGGSSNMIVATKSGTNQYHGSLYEYNRTSAGLARDYFNFTNKLPPYIRNQFGASAGDPIRHNKTFFFGDYEGTRIRASSQQLFSVPTAQMRTGNFQGLVGSNSQPLTLKAPSQLPFVLAPGEPLFSAANVINPFYLSGSASNPNAANAKIANQVLSLYAQPNLPGPSNNLSGQIPQAAGTNNYTAKLDHMFSEKMNVSGHMTLSMPLPYLGADPRAPSLQNSTYSRGANVGATLTNVLTPQMINQFTFGWQDWKETTGFSPSTDFEGQYGISVPYPSKSSFNLQGIPVYSFVGNGAMSQLSYNSTTTNDGFPRLLQTSHYVFNENLTWTHGRQTLKFGGQFGLLDLADFANPFPRGSITYNGNTGALSTGYSIADLLLGLPNNSQYTLLSAFYYHTTEDALYAQSDWKVTGRLTVNAGVRWERRPPMTEENGAMAGFDPVSGKLVIADPGGKMSNLLYPNLLDLYGKVIVTASSLGWDDSRIYKTNNMDWAPRAGFAYQLDKSSKTVVRSGYGIFYSNFPLQSVQSISQVPPFSAISNATSSAANMLTNTNPFRVQAGTLNYAPFEHQFLDAYTQQWNFAVERAIPSQNVVSVTYTGNKGTHLRFWNSATTVPNLGTIQLATSNATSIYNSLQTEIRRRYAHGFAYQANWTWAKSIDDGAGLGAGQAIPQIFASGLKAERGNNAYARRHVIRGNLLWAIPLGRGQRFGAGMPKALNLAIGGWSLGAIGSIQTGGYFTPTVTGAFSSRPNVVPDVSVQLTDSTRHQLAQQTGDQTWLDPSKHWFNTGAFSLVPSTSGVFGNAGRGIIVGPGFFQVDSILSKSFAIRDRIRLAARVESFNVTNHTNFSGGNMQVTVNNPAAGSITSTTGNPRSMQFALRLEF